MRLQGCAVQGLYKGGQGVQRTTHCRGGYLARMRTYSAGPGMSLASLQCSFFIPSLSCASHFLPLHFQCSAVLGLQQTRFAICPVAVLAHTSASFPGFPSEALQSSIGSRCTSYGSVRTFALVPSARQQFCPPSQLSSNGQVSMTSFWYSSSPSRYSVVNSFATAHPEFETAYATTGVVSDDLAVQENLLWSALKERRTEDAWQALKRMRRQGLLPGGACFSRMVAQLCHQGTSLSLTRAQKVMADLQQHDKLDLLDRDALGLLAMAAARGGAARYALKVVRFMLQKGIYPSVKIWSAVISRLGKSVDDSKLALEVFDEICELVTEGSKDETTMNKMITMRPDTGAYNAALNACATAGLVEKGMSLLEQMRSQSFSPDILTFNILIKLYARAEQRGELQRVVVQMLQAGVEPDASTLSSLVAAFVGLGDIREAERLVKHMQAGSYAVEVDAKDRDKAEVCRLEESSGISSHVPGQAEKMGSQGSVESDELRGGVDMPDMANKNSDPSSSWIRHLKVKPDARTYTTLMKGYVQCGRLKDAIQILVAMQNHGDPGSVPNEVTYTTAMSALIKLGMLDEARSILLEMSAHNVPANIVTYNTLLSGYCGSQQLDKAFALVDDMAKVGIQLDVVSYNTLINGCIKSDDNAKGLEMFQKMRSAGILPSAISYTTLITAFGKNSQPKLAAQVFEEMRKDERIKVDTVAWNAYIDAFCKAGEMGNARKAFLAMKEAGVEPSVATYNSLVRGYAASGNHQSGEVLVLWKEIQQRMEAKKGDGNVPLTPDEGLLNCLVDTCVRAGFFQRAIEVVACIEQHGLPANKAKYKRMFIELYSNLYTGKHASQRRRDKSKDRRRAVEAFKFWVGLPNNYYESDWSPLKAE